MEGQTQLSSNDHDLIVESRVDIRDIKSNILELKGGVSAQIANIMSEVKSYEPRIKKLESLVEQTQPLDRLKEFDLFKKEFTEQQIANKYSRRNWAIFQTIATSVVITILEALTLHFIGKI